MQMIDETLNTEPENPSEEPKTSENTTEKESAATETSEPQTPEQLIAEEKDKYLRLYSEFDNYRRRTTKERFELLQTAGRDVILSMLEIVDDFERALKILENADSAVKTGLEGFELIYKKLISQLEARGVKPMDCKGKPFDVEFHEAITRFPAPTEADKGMVIDEVEKGYLLNGHVLRFAKVVVGE
jgi:molecular chaperone GrpE